MVTLAELFEADIDGIETPIPKIIVEIEERMLQRIGIRLDESQLDESQLDESQWVPSRERGLWLRVDPARPEMNQHRHVHIAQKKHITAANKQASWNDNRTRHDRQRFNTKFGARADVQTVARAALCLPPDAVLEHITNLKAPATMLLEAALRSDYDSGSSRPVFLRVKRHQEPSRRRH